MKFEGNPWNRIRIRNLEFLFSMFCFPGSLVFQRDLMNVVCRLINDAPHYMSVMDEEEHASLGTRTFTLPFLSTPHQDHVLRWISLPLPCM
jgi:hypothetical protein